MTSSLKESFSMPIVMVSFFFMFDKVVSHPYVHSVPRTPSIDNYNRQFLTSARDIHHVPSGYFSLDPHTTNYHDLGDGTVVAYGEKFQLVNVPVNGVNRLVPLSLQYAVRIPQPIFSEFNKAASTKHELTQKHTLYTNLPESKKEDIHISPPRPPSFSNIPGTIDFLPLIDNRHIKVLNEKQGNSFNTKPSLGEVPVVQPGTIRPFSLFWYLPVNPQIKIETKKDHKNGNKLYKPVRNQYHNQIYGLNRYHLASPIYRPPGSTPLLSHYQQASVDPYLYNIVQ